ncbi:MAG: DUF2225 domain-containing protein [Clostridia bacterium]|jgi:uncharacterized protein (DUF2225 family)|nr:DUF2225 domain-containing protein [Clostridiales bacterium]
MNASLYRVEVDCPVCRETFSTSRVRSKFCVVESRDTDFCVYYKGCNPIFYEAAVCSKCGYAALYDRFTEIGPEDAGRVYSRFAGKWNGRDFGSERSIEDALDAYKLALYCSQLRKDVTADIFTSICMRMAWLYRIKGDTEEERRFLAHALEQYMVLYDRGDTPEKMDEITLIYLMGELNRRLGNADDAVIWFSRVVSHSMAGQKPLIVRMAREQWSMVRNTIKESGQDG